MNIKRRHRILKAGKSPSLEALKKTYNRAVLNGGVTVDFSNNVENIRSISRKLGYNVLKDAPFVYTPSSYGESRNFVQNPSLRNLVTLSEELDNGVWNKQSVTITPNQINAPNGTLTADKIEATVSSTFCRIRYVLNNTNTRYTQSIFAKAGTTDYICIETLNTGSAPAIFNLSNGTVNNNNGSANIQSVGNGWYLISCQINVANPIMQIAPCRNGDRNAQIGDNVYIWGAQLELGLVATPYQRTTDGIADFTSTRTTISRVTNKQGIIEDSCYNLVQFSEQPDNGYWAKSGINVSANIITAPSGTLTSDKLVEDSTNTRHMLYKDQTNLLITNNIYNYSIYAKAAERSKLIIVLDNPNYTNGRNSVAINLSNGTYTFTGSGGDSLPLTIQVLPDIDGWYRCALTFNSNTSTTFQIKHLLFNSGVYQGDGISGLYICGAQLTQGADLRPYIRTTNRLNVPKLDYSRGLGKPELLLERQSANLALQSETLDNVIWLKTGVTIVPNTNSNPFGNNKSYYLNNNSPNIKTLKQNRSVTIGEVYTTSFYVKKAADSWIQIANDTTTFGTNSWINFNFDTGLFGNNGGSGTWTKTPLADGWWKLTITGTVTVTTTAGTGVLVGCNNIDSVVGFPSYTGTVHNIVDVAAIQIELGSNATSYIPTTTTAVTRNADANWTDLWNNNTLSQNNFTLFIEGYLYDNTLINSSIMLSDSITGFQPNCLSISNGMMGMYRDSDGISKTVGTSLPNNSIYKVVVQRNGTQVKYFRNGVQLGTAQTVSVYNYRYLTLNSGGNTYTTSGLYLFNRTLSDAECTTITQIPLSGLTAYYTLSNNTNDITSQTPNGVATGIDYVTGKVSSNAARFNSYTDKVDIVDTDNLSFTDGTNDLPFSISMWINVASYNTQNSYLMTKDSIDAEWEMTMSPSGDITFLKYDSVYSVQAVRIPNGSVPLNTWTLVTFTDDGSKTTVGMNIYINGVLKSKSPLTSGAYTGMSNTSSIVRIGQLGYSESLGSTAQDYAFNGSMQEVGIWKNKTLTQDEITLLYNSGNGKIYPFT